jgi:hypothetical protein
VESDKPTSDEHRSETEPAMKQDSSWRKILDKLLPEFLAYYFPKIHQAIDFERGFEFLDYRQRWEDLERDPNPFAIVTRAFLKTVETQGNDIDRYRWKRNFLLALYHSGMSHDTVLALFEFISVVMALPEAKDEELYDEITPTAEEKHMSLLAIAERKGIEKGLQQTLADILEIKFGVGALSLAAQVEQIESLEVLQKIRAGLKQARTLEEAESVIRTFAPVHG